MNTNLDQVLAEVSPSKFLRMENAAGTTVSCVAGSLWVTADNCIKDFEILPGDTYVANGRQSITLCGFEPSVVRVFQPRPSQLRRHVARNSALDSARSFVAHLFATLGSIKHRR
jgi:hypothetical protein